MGVFRNSAARAIAPQFDYSNVLYDPAVSGPYLPSIATNDASDGGQGFWTPLEALTAADEVFVANGFVDGFVSEILKVYGFRFNIDPAKSVAGFKFDLLFAWASGAQQTITARLFKANGVPRVMSRSITVAVGTGETGTGVNYTLGGALDSWDEPWTPEEVSHANFGVALRRETTVGGGAIFIDAVRLTVYTTDNVLPVLQYAAGTYNFGPTAIASGKTSISFYLDATLHTNSGVVATVNVEISYDSGSNWETLINATGAGGTVAGPSGVTEPRWWMRRDLPDSGNANRQYRGSLVISGGSLVTSIGVFVN